MYGVVVSVSGAAVVAVVAVVAVGGGVCVVCEFVVDGSTIMERRCCW